MRRYRSRLSRNHIRYLAALLLLWQAQNWLYANPKGGEAVRGQVEIQQDGHKLTIRQQGDRAILQWQDFSIAQGEITKFLQPGRNSATLNRVVGGKLSEIYGTLEANGKVYLINPNGIVVGPTGVINTAGFIGSTLDVTNEEFLAGGDMTFRGNSTAKVVNMGKIGATDSDVILIAQEVENLGTITAPNGTAALAAGQEVLVKATGAERVFVQAGKGSVTNSGLIDAAAAEIKAAGGNEYALAINNTGTVRATGVVNQGGRILLTANAGKVRNAGTLTTRRVGAVAAAQPKGEIKVLAPEVELASTAVIESPGGFVETSGTTVNVADGARVTTLLEGGAAGLWLIDPNDFTIAASGGNMTGAAVGAALAGGNFTIQTATSGTAGGNGDIFVNDAITWTNGNKLTLDAERFVRVNNLITGSSGVLTLLGPSGVFVEGSGVVRVNALRAEASNGSVIVALGSTTETISEIGVVSGRASGDFYVAAASSYQIGKVDNVAGLIVGGTLTLANQALGGTVTQASGADGAITAATLSAKTAGSIFLTNSLNSIATIGSLDTTFSGASFIDSSFTLVNNGALSIDSIQAKAGIDITSTGVLTTTTALSSNGNIALRSTAATLSLGAAVTSVQNGVTLRSFGALNTGASLVSAATVTTGDVTLISDNSTVAIGTGGVLVGDTLGIRVGAGVTLNIGGPVTAPNVILIADNIDISAAINATGTIALAPVTTGTAWRLGGSVGSGAIDSNELTFLTSASTLSIGRNTLSSTTTAGALTIINGSVASATLNLFSAAGISQVAGSLGVGGGSGALNITAGGTVDLAGSMEVGSLSGSTTSGSFSVLRSSPTTQALTVNAITTAGGDIAVRNFDGDVTVAGAVTSNGGNIVLGANAGTGQQLHLQAAVNAGSGSIYLFSNGGITQTSAGLLTAANLLAGTTSGGTGSITLDQNNVIANQVGFSTPSGASISFRNTGGFTVGGIGSLSVAGLGFSLLGGPGIRTSAAGSVTLTAGGNITQASGGTDIISTGTLNIAANGSANPNVTLNNAGNAMTNLGTVALGTGSFTLADTGGLTLTGEVTAQGGVAISTTGAMTINIGAAIDARNGDATLSATGNLSFSAEVRASTTGTVTLESTGGSIVQQSSSVLYGSKLRAVAATNVDIGVVSNRIGGGGVAASATTGSILFVSGGQPIHIDQVGATSGLTAGGAIILGSNNGGITQTANGLITAGAGLGIASPGGSILLDQANLITGNIAVSNSGTQNVTIRNTGNFNIGLVGGASSVTNPGVTVDGIRGTTATGGFISLRSDTGTITQSVGSDIFGGELRLQTAGQNAILNNIGNQMTGIGASNLGAGRLEVFDNTGGLLANGTITANGGIQVRTRGDLTLNAGASFNSSAAGNSVVLAGANFINDAGAAAVDPGAGRFLIYSTAPASNTFGGLVSGQQALYNRTYDANGPSTITEAGNRYVFSAAPGTLTVESSFSDTKTYGETYTPPAAVLGTHYTITGFVNAAAYGNVFTQDTAANIGLTGVPTFSSAGDGAAASVAGSPYTFVFLNNTLANTAGYTFGTPVSTGGLTITAATLTITAANQQKVYGDTFTFNGNEYSVSGLLGSDTVTGVTFTSAGAAAIANVVGSPYAIIASNAAGTGLGNYTITYVDGALTVTPRAITVTAGSGQSVYGDKPVTPGLKLTGGSLANGDTLESLGLGSSFNIRPTTGVGTYAISVKPDAGSNYMVTTTGGTWVVTPRTISVMALPGQGKAFRASDPELLFAVEGLVNGDALQGALARAGGENPGLYEILLGGLDGSPNYLIDFTGADFQILPVPFSTLDAQLVLGRQETVADLLRQMHVFLTTRREQVLFFQGGTKPDNVLSAESSFTIGQ